MDSEGISADTPAYGWLAPCVRLFRARLPKASQLGQKGPVVRKQASFERRLTVRSSEIRCSVSPWRCFGRAHLGPIEIKPSAHAHAHPHRAGPTPLTTKTPGVDLHEGQCVPCPPLCRRRSFARAANILLYPYYPPDGFHLEPCLATRTFPQPQHSTSRVSATLEPASHKLSEPSWNLERPQYIGALLPPRDLRIKLSIEGLIATNKRAAVQGSSSVLRPRPRRYCFSLHFAVHPPPPCSS